MPQIFVKTAVCTSHLALKQACTCHSCVPGASLLLPQQLLCACLIKAEHVPAAGKLHREEPGKRLTALPSMDMAELDAVLTCIWHSSSVMLCITLAWRHEAFLISSDTSIHQYTHVPSSDASSSLHSALKCAGCRAYIPLGAVLDCIELAHDYVNVLEEVLEEGFLGPHLVSCLLAILHGPVPRGQGKHKPHLAHCEVL